jgi:hypothetical protein
MYRESEVKIFRLVKLFQQEALSFSAAVYIISALQKVLLCVPLHLTMKPQYYGRTMCKINCNK